MQRFILLFLLFAAGGLAAGAAAQDAVQTLPKNYRLEFENEWVRVVRVRYGAHEKLPAHTHTEWATAYVYLNDAGPVIFRHIGLSYGAITRPAVKAGSFRLYKSVKEVHEVENPGDTASEFLRVEFKTEPVNDKTLHGKFHRESAFEPAQATRVQFENEQLRATRLRLAPGAKETIRATTEPALLVALTEAKLSAAGRPAALAMGRTRWIGPKREEVLENTGATEIELLRFDLRTPPAKARTKEAEHKHPHD